MSLLYYLQGHDMLTVPGDSCTVDIRHRFASDAKFKNLNHVRLSITLLMLQYL